MAEEHSTNYVERYEQLFSASLLERVKAGERFSLGDALSRRDRDVLYRIDVTAPRAGKCPPPSGSLPCPAHRAQLLPPRNQAHARIALRQRAEALPTAPRGSRRGSRCVLLTTRPKGRPALTRSASRKRSTSTPRIQTSSSAGTGLGPPSCAPCRQPLGPQGLGTSPSPAALTDGYARGLTCASSGAPLSCLPSQHRP